jgi:hypothetical protein
MRLSRRRAAYVDVASSAKQEIRVRSGRDDNSVKPAKASERNTRPLIELSSRPERSVVEGPAVSFPGYFHGLTCQRSRPKAPPLLFCARLRFEGMTQRSRPLGYLGFAWIPSFPSR